MKPFFLLGFFVCFASITAQTDENEIPEGFADVPVSVVEQVPVFPGCDKGTNAEQRKCLVEMIQQHVVRNFDKSRIETAGLSPGKYRIAVQFKIDQDGKVADVRSRADHEIIEAEAIRVIHLLPRMIPGVQRGQKVGVLYALPILFEIEPPKRIQRARSKKGKNSGTGV